MGPKLISGNYWELAQPQESSTQRWFNQQKKMGRTKEWGKEVTITSLSVQVHKRKEWQTINDRINGPSIATPFSLCATTVYPTELLKTSTSVKISLSLIEMVLSFHLHDHSNLGHRVKWPNCLPLDAHRAQLDCNEFQELATRVYLRWVT